MVRKLPRPPIEKLNFIVNLHNDEALAPLNQEINNFYNRNKMTDEIRRSNQLRVNVIAEYLRTEGVRNQFESIRMKFRGITVFGSFPTQCATIDSDLDLCVCASTSAQNAAKPAAVLQCIYRDLVNNPKTREFFNERGHKINGLNFISSATVPIIQFKIDNVRVDLSSVVSNSPPRTSLAAKYINAYCQLDNRFPIMVIFLKKWMASERGANDHLRDFPNSYSITLLLIHVLQWYGIFPNIYNSHPNIFNKENFNDWDLVDYQSSDFKEPLEENFVFYHNSRRTRSLTVMQLLHLFAHHYSNQHLVDTCLFNMFNGEIEERDLSCVAFHVLDPYDSRNPARSARSPVDFAYSLKDFRRLLTQPSSNNILNNLWRITKEKTYLSHNPAFLFDRTQPRLLSSQLGRSTRAVPTFPEGIPRMIMPYDQNYHFLTAQQFQYSGQPTNSSSSARWSRKQN